jgi:ribulose-phosphate 3-epimerase
MMQFQSPLLAPSILAADYTRLGQQIKTCIDSGIEWIHCDIMDGHFVPNISYGPAIVKAANRSADAFLDVHLMIENPAQYIHSFVESGADLITVHQEACPHLHRTIQQIKEHDIGAGVAVNPSTPLQHILPIVEYVDLVLIMSVNPGFGGQQFIESTYKKIKDLAVMRRTEKADFLIEVDGGVGFSNIKKVAAAGADVLVAGSAVFKSDNIPQRIKELTQKAKAGKSTFV